MRYTITVEAEPNTPYPDYSHETDNEQGAIKQAREWAKEHKKSYVYISYFRPKDGQHGYLNPDGYNLQGKDWVGSILPTLYGVTEFAKELGTSRQAIHRDYKRGKLLEPATYAGNRPMWTLEQIKQYKPQ